MYKPLFNLSARDATASEMSKLEVFTKAVLQGIFSDQETMDFIRTDASFMKTDQEGIIAGVAVRTAQAVLKELDATVNIELINEAEESLGKTIQKLRAMSERSKGLSTRTETLLDQLVDELAVEAEYHEDARED